MMYIAEIDLKKKKRQLIPLTRICLFGYVDGKRKNLEKNCTFAFINMTIYGIETYPYRRLASGPDLFRLRPGGGARGFPRFSDKSIGGAADGCPVDRRRCVRRDEPFRGAQRRFYRFLREANRLNPGLQIVIIAGNHDSAIRLEAPNPLLEELNTSIVGIVGRTDSGRSTSLRSSSL